MSETVEAIKERLDIAALISEYMPLKQAGQSLKGLCPFHQEKSPSFTVSASRGTWHCFGCSEGGDAFTFIQKIEGLDFPGALRLLAERTGVQIVKQDPKSTNHRQKLFDVLQLATQFYQQLLLKHKGAAKVLEYLKERGLTLETIELFGLGYAPMQWNTLYTYLQKKGVSLGDMAAVGLTVTNAQGKTYDRFRGRIMFPVYDTQGRVVAFGGRIVPWHATGNEGKYINSPETALYEKRRVVYNLHRAKQFLRGGTPAIVVEGYMDAILLTQAGFNNVVASSGTAFTAEHIVQLARFTKTLHFAFDGDGAGWKATIAATGAALTSGMNVATIALPEGQDPADIVLKSPEKLTEIFNNPVSLITLLMRQLGQESNISTREEQLTTMLPLLKTVKNPIVQGQMVQEIAHTLHVPEQNIHRLLLSTSGLALDTTQAETAPALPELFNKKEAMPEWHLLGLVLLSPEVRAYVFPRLYNEIFLDSKSQMVYKSLQHLAETQSDFLTLQSSTLISALPESTTALAEGLKALAEESLLFGGAGANAQIEGAAIYERLHRRFLTSRLNVLQEQLSSGSETQRQEALQAFQLVTQELSAISTS